LFVSLSLSLSTLFHHFHPTSTLGFFYITHHPATNTSLNKRRSAVHVKKEFLFMLSIAYNTHSRYSGICLLGNVVSGKTYRQLSEQASEQKEEESKKDRMTTFLTQV
jgi:hypothetical protein